MSSRAVTAITLSVFAAACAADGGGPPIDTQPVWHLDTALSPAEGDLGSAGPAYVKSLDGELDLGLSDEDAFQLVRVATGPDGLRHALLQQLHDGVPVEGGQLLLHADDTTFLGLNGYLTRHLGGFDVAPAIDESAALDAARAERAAGAEIEFAIEDARLVILPGTAGGAALAWRVELYNEPQPDLAAGRWIYFVDAGSRAILESHDALPTEQASGPGGTPKKARRWSGQLDVEYAGAGQYEMTTDRLSTYDLANGYTMPATAVRGPLDPISDAAIDDAHGYAEVTLDMMRDWYGLDSIDENGYRIISRVHYGVDYENAFWNGFMMTYGDGKDLFYPLSGALDVVSHEINHGFTSFHSDLTYAGMSGGLNESFSDIAGTLAEFSLEGDGADFLIGEDIFKLDGALRFLCDPRADRDFYKQQYGLDNYGSIDHASDFTPSLDVHFASGVPNKAFCLSVARFKVTGTDARSTPDAARRVGAAWYLANQSYWTMSTTYTEGCQGVITAAHALGFTSEEVEALRASWADVGVECGDTVACNFDGVCDADAGETCLSCPGDCDACNQPCSAWKKRKCDLGTGDCSGCDAPPGCGDGLCTDDETDATCGADCGCAAASADCEGLAPIGCWCDATCEQFGDCCADVAVCR
jgi:pseudolysin/vibriolysin